MMSEKFGAGVTYGDWEGTAAADDADQTNLTIVLRERGLLGENEILIGIHAYIGENHPGIVQTPFISALIFCGSSPSHDEALSQVRLADPVPVKRVRLDLPLEEFVSLFKRFSIAISLSGFEFANREYDVAEEVTAK
jgi:hypothetical protein